MSSQRIRGFLIAGIVTLIFFTELAIAFAPDKVADWFIQIGATFLAAFAAFVIGFAQFGYQQRETTRTKRDEFRALVRAELEETAERLRTSGATDLEPETTLDYVSPLALEEAVKSGLFSTTLAQRMMSVARQFHTYNVKVSNVLAYRHLYEESSQESWQRLDSSRRGAANQADHLVDLCTELLTHEELSESR